MLRLLIFFVFLTSVSFCVFGQKVDVGYFIKAWSVSDKTQTEKAEITYKILKSQFNPLKLENAVKELKAYISKNPSKRLETRLRMFEVLGKREFKIVLHKQDTLKVAEAIKFSRILNDDQLLAEVYALAADINFEDGYLLYNLKALELQERIGYQYFSFVQNRFFGASLAMYRTMDYEESIGYGKKGLAFKDVKLQFWDPMVYIFQLDMIGASYLALKKYDLAIDYYQQIVDTVSKKPISLAQQELWLAIANGNIGRCVFLKGDASTALPLLNKHLEVAEKYNQENNIAIAQNARGEVFLSQKKYLLALQCFKHSLQAAYKSSHLAYKVKASSGLTTTFSYLGMVDSAILYQEKYASYLAEQNQLVNRSKLSVMNAKIRFDNSQRHLEEANASITRLKFTRNVTVVAILLLAVIGLLLYNRQTLKLKLEKQQIVFEASQARMEVDQARASLGQFQSQMREKDKLIANLSQSLKRTSLENNEEAALVSKNLLAYLLVTDEEWMSFRRDFNKVYPLFYPRLRSLLSNLTEAEERLASLIFLQMSNKEIARTLGISVDSVARSKRRLKQRFLLNEGQTLESCILALT